MEGALAIQSDEALYMSGRYLQGLIEYVKRMGANPAPVLEALACSEEQLREPDHLVLHTRQDAAFAAAEAVARDAHVGLHAGAASQLTQFGIVGQLALTCRTGAELIDLGIRHQGLIGNGIRSSCARVPGAVRLRYELQRPTLPRHVLMYTLAAQMSLARMLVGPKLGLQHVSLSYAAPPEAAQEEAFFECPVRYGAEHVEILAPAEFDRIELVRCEPGVREALEVAARSWLQSLQERVPSGDDPIVQCKRHIMEGLCSDAHGIEQVAARMHVSVRTLQRRLDEHGTSFRELVEVARREATERLMENPKLSLLDIALLVGFSEQSAFNRAARRWFDMTPSEYRARLRTRR